MPHRASKETSDKIDRQREDDCGVLLRWYWVQRLQNMVNRRYFGKKNIRDIGGGLIYMMATCRYRSCNAEDDSAMTSLACATWSSWLTYSADSYYLDLSVLSDVHDKCQYEIWKNTAGKSANADYTDYAKYAEYICNSRWSGRSGWSIMLGWCLVHAGSPGGPGGQPGW